MHRVCHCLQSPPRGEGSTAEIGQPMRLFDMKRPVDMLEATVVDMLLFSQLVVKHAPLKTKRILRTHAHGNQIRHKHPQTKYAQTPANQTHMPATMRTCAHTIHVSFAPSRTQANTCTQHTHPSTQTITSRYGTHTQTDKHIQHTLNTLAQRI